MRGYAEALWGQWYASATPETLDADRFQIVQMNGEDVGCVKVTDHGDHHFLDRLFILPEWQGKGIGAEVLKQKQADAEAVNVPLRFTVLTSNLNAKRFYERNGFAVTQQTAERFTMEKQR